MLIEKLYLHFEGEFEKDFETLSSRGGEILDGGFARSKVNIDVSRARPLDRISFFFYFFNFFFPFY